MRKIFEKLSNFGPAPKVPVGQKLWNLHFPIIPKMHQSNFLNARRGTKNRCSRKAICPPFFGGIQMFYHNYRLQNWSTNNTIHTKTFIAFKQDVNAVNVVNCTKINFPPRGFIWWIGFYCIGPHTRNCISIKCIACLIQVMQTRSLWKLGGIRFKG